MHRFSQTIVLAMLALAGPATSVRSEDSPQPYLPEPVAEVPALNSQFERGKPRKIVDAIGWTFGIPKKIILWDRRANNHNVSLETEQNLAQYLEANGLTSTKVRVNQYDPVGEWQRLHANKEVGAGWRYTIGAFNTLTYTVFPGRLFGSDRYNPYTDSMYIYSDIPCLAQEQGAYSKLVHSRIHPGTYAAVSSLPFVQLYPEKQSKNDVLDYTLQNGTPEQHEEATRVFYAEYGAEVGGQTSLLLGSNIPLTLAGAGVGHVAARYKALTAPEETAIEAAAPEATTAEPPTPVADAESTASQTNEVGPIILKR